MPKLSIVTINLNNTFGLQRTIASVFNQAFQDYEHIVIDGGSIDGSGDVLKQYKNNKLKWISEKDHGIYNAMNKGILKSSGEVPGEDDSLRNGAVISKYGAHRH